MEKIYNVQISFAGKLFEDDVFEMEIKVKAVDEEQAFLFALHYAKKYFPSAIALPEFAIIVSETVEKKTVKNMVIEAVNECCFVNTDGEWCSTRTPEEFKRFLEKEGFEVVDCFSRPGTTAIAITTDGYRIAWNGHCRKLTREEQKRYETV